ncbi:MAG: hypothetical protein ACI837_001090 [Crocinitomicaceae bacterium]|jgi:hypothetical protein
MKLVIILIFIGAFFSSFAASSWGKPMLTYHVLSSEADSTIQSGMSRISITTPYVQILKKDKLLYGYDGKSYTTSLDDEGRTNFTLAPGKYIFQFYLSSVSNYAEIETDTVEIIEGFNTTIQLNFRKVSIRPSILRKPVIYLYPEEETQITLGMDIHGTEQFLYPKYEDQWEFTAHPSGDLQFGENTYNYLFWEAKSNDVMQLDRSQPGFIVQQNEVVFFLEEKLTLANLSSKEKADFITFWGPLLVQNDLNLVHFIFNEECNHYAEMNIQPTPSSIYRIYIVWAPISEHFEIQEQTIQAANRDGFHLIEWGGFETTIQSKLAALEH